MSEIERGDAKAAAASNADADRMPDPPQKRVVILDKNAYWNKDIVTYVISESAIKAYAKDYLVVNIKKAIKRWESVTCLRFKEYNTVDGKTTNEREGLGHDTYINFIYDPGRCWSLVGNQRVGGPQDVSCCDQETCVHELGHALGLQHEHVSTDPERQRQMRVEEDVLTSAGKNNYADLDPSEYGALVGYDVFSLMHYSPVNNKFITENKGPSHTYLYREFNDGTGTGGGFHYMAMEVSLAYTCAARYCPDAKVTCVNDGFLTLVDDTCSCKYGRLFSIISVAVLY